jgi:hypothetical protein
MVKWVYSSIVLSIIIICFANCRDVKDEQQIDKINIFYESSDLAPWGIFRLPLSTSQFMRISGLNEISITNKDSLSFVYSHIKDIKSAVAQPHDKCKNIDAGFVFLVHYGENIDTIAMNAYPDYMLYNDYKFRDSILGYFIINAIRERDLKFDKKAEKHFYNGEYNFFPNGVFSNN